MGDRRPLSSMTSGDFDHPPASITLAENVRTRLSRLQRTLERTREESNNQAETARHERWGVQPSLRRRRLLRPAGPPSPTYESRNWSRSDESPDEDEDRPRQAKRRKLDLYSHNIHEKAYRYGHYGQVEQGRLKMELCSCDGGVYQERGPIYYGPSNILKHDQSVYCSKSPQCNIIIRHHDNTAFCLEKLYILGPEHGFTSPVKHGTVCIGMGLEDLMPLTAEELLYGGQERQPTMSPSDDEGDGGEQLSLLESLRDPEISRAMRQRAGTSWDHPPPPYAFPEPLPPAQRTGNRDGRVWTNDFFWPPLEPRNEQVRTRNQQESPVESTLDSGMRVIVDHEERIEWPEEPTTAAVLADRQRRERHARDGELESDEEHSRAWDPRYTTAFNRLRRGIRLPRDLPQDPSAVAAARKTPTNDVTQVRFSMQHGKSRVAIKFDPPV
ncbi:hypothetical protein CAC42_4316 [Sphaceloma murrayae]|uniref:Uncharacterized protein n=1 Tax=Sphaceloma murrayae TaxID=2082308 RepID=A0A2K1QL41_9PEZI|nr:hypothetical protein CAC42_4316 [Sphaceloma murrayae]